MAGEVGKTVDIVDEIVANWWKQDFSWEGLAHKQTDARGAPESLQSYWMHVYARLTIGTDYQQKNIDLAELIKPWLKEFDGRLWVPFQYPFVSRPEVTPQLNSLKSYHGTEDALSLKRMFDDVLALVDTGFLRFADFSGSCFDFSITIERGRPLRARFDSCDFSRDFVCRDEVAGIKTAIKNSMFDAPAGRDLGFDDPAQFVHARFGQAANFEAVAFAGSCYFFACFFRRAVFTKSIVQGEGDMMVFYRTRFGRAEFDDIKVRFVTFYDCEFDAAASFTGAEFNSGRFYRTVFKSSYAPADFSFTTFRGYAGFRETEFHGGVLFEGATVSRMEDKARLWERLDFSGASFLGVADFSGFRCELPADFSGASSIDKEAGAQFGEIIFKPGLSQRTPEVETRRGAPPLRTNLLPTVTAEPSWDSRWQSRMKLRGSHFSFRKVAKARVKENHLRPTVFHRSVDFSGRTFKRNADFTKAEFRGHVNFSGAAFEREPMLVETKWPDLSTIDEYDKEKMRRDFRRKGVTDDRELDRQVRRNRRAYKDEQNLLMEATFRFLKRVMERFRNKPEEDRFYMYELQRRFRRRDISISERLFAGGYSVLSRFGTTIGRPLWWFAGVNAALFLVYCFVMHVQNGARCTVGSAATFTFERLFAPFSIWDSQYLGAHLNDCFGSFLDAGGLPIRLLSSANSLVDGVLLFLVALAIRRRFRIN